MLPKAYLDAFWRMELEPRVFVAMSFAREYDDRFWKIIAPAVADLAVASQPLTAYRIDTSASGDAITTDIINGIIHSQLFLADVSTVGRDAKNGTTYRNGNVMYEVGIAVSCRQPYEILLVHDDNDRLLFDVSTIPHRRINFVDEGTARTQLTSALKQRLAEQNHLKDARVERAIRSLSYDELSTIKFFLQCWPQQPFGFELQKQGINSPLLTGVSRLVDKGVLHCQGQGPTGEAMFEWTPLGAYVAERIRSGVFR
jgi:hypothetical protein